MRLLEFVPCGRKAASRTRHGAPRGAAAEEAAPVGLLPAAATTKGKRRSRGAGAAGYGAASQWRPSLGVISEDRVLPAEAGAEEKRRQQRAAASTGQLKAALAASARRLDYRGDFRHFTAPAVFPAFAPTAFLF